MAKSNSTLSQKRLKEVLDYDPGTGNFTWIKSSSNRIKAGAEAGSIHPHGYRIIGVHGIRYRAHHLAFLWMAGSLPDDHVDHINRVKHDNRWENLRVIGHAGNQRNRRGPKGWFYCKLSKKPYYARIYARGKRIFLGSFSTPQAAEAAYLKAKVRYHKEYTPE